MPTALPDRPRRNVNFPSQFSHAVPGSSHAQMSPAAPSGPNGLVNGTGAPASSHAASTETHPLDPLRLTAQRHLDLLRTKKKRTSTSEGKKAQIEADPDDSDEVLGRLEDIERRYEIPPLKLIDTGNPEADAEANRLAIEEDKRRRNTAASARFRIKKKQREAALENATKELQQRLSDLKLKTHA